MPQDILRVIAPAVYTGEYHNLCFLQILTVFLSHSMKSDATYISPPSLTVLGNATYNIKPVDITASSLHTYINGGLNYDDSTINDKIEQTISLENNETFLSQGVRFQGVWTLPVCNVGHHGNWVADYTDGMMPCCCGKYPQTFRNPFDNI
jgi:hypothetical protein